MKKGVHQEYRDHLVLQHSLLSRAVDAAPTSSTPVGNIWGKFPMYEMRTDISTAAPTQCGRHIILRGLSITVGTGSYLASP